MSIILAVRKDDRILVASDTLTSFGESHRVPADNACAAKVRRIGTSVVGGSGWGVYDQILDAHLEEEPDPDLSSDRAIFVFFIGLWKAMHDKYQFVNDQAQSKDSPFGDLDASFLIANEGGIFKVSSDMAVTEFKKYYAIGSGSEYALGAMHVLYDGDGDAEAVARGAVATAIEFDAYCGGETHVLAVEPS